MTNAVTYSVSEGIADIILTRPPVNALDLATVREIIAALRRATADTDVGAVVISSGTPRRFCAGLDLDQVQGKSVTEMHTLLSALYVELRCRITEATAATVSSRWRTRSALVRKRGSARSCCRPLTSQKRFHRDSLAIPISTGRSDASKAWYGQSDSCAQP